jgi:3-hydroxy-9,10-secoandrosta-1,3,5(10)-triene-9,17-dione monooxygenase
MSTDASAKSLVQVPALPPPVPDMTPERLVGLARSLRQQLRAEQAESEERGSYSADMHEQLVAGGLYRVLQPRRFGGYECDIPTYYRTIVEVATGDPGSGWCLALAAGHAFTVSAHFEAQAQYDVFLPDGEFRAPLRPLATGVAAARDGGYVITGTWNYASSVPYATHFIGKAKVSATETEQPREILFIVPRQDFTILDDWGHGQVLGLQASGSNSVQVDGAFVPEHHTIVDWRNREFPGGTPGTTLHGNPMYLGRTHSFSPGEIVATMVGAARASLEEYEAIIRTKKTIAPPQVLQVEHHDSKRVFGLALSQTDTAEAILMSAAETYMQHCRRWATTGETFTIKDDIRLYGIVMHAGRLAAEAVEMLFRASGTSVTWAGHRLQRYFRDVSMYRTHFIAQYDTLAQMFATSYFDQDPA